MKEMEHIESELPASMKPSMWPAVAGVLLISAGLFLPWLSVGERKSSTSQKRKAPTPKTKNKHHEHSEQPEHCPLTGPKHGWDGWRRSMRLTMETLPPRLEQLKPLHCRKGQPGPHDWLTHHKEPGQSLRAYKDDVVNRPTTLRTTIVIQPLGSFGVEQKILLRYLARYMEAYFCLPVRLQKSFEPRLPKRARRAGYLGEQHLTSHLALHVLKPRIPKDALVLLGFTTNDLWPGGGWNFVYGTAYPQIRTGVWSLRRLGGRASNNKQAQRILRRILKIATHEAGHLLSLPHCVAYECNMNGGNHLAEMESTPMALCPVCLGKLLWNTKCDPIQRFSRLQALMKEWGLKDEATFFAQAKAKMMARPNKKSNKSAP